MQVERAIDVFQQLDSDQKALVLARFSFELTIVARETYKVGTEDIEDPQRLRKINEVQHRVTSALTSILKKTERYPDDVLVRIIFDGNDRGICAAFERAAGGMPASGN